MEIRPDEKASNDLKMRLFRRAGEYRKFYPLLPLESRCKSVKTVRAAVVSDYLQGAKSVMGFDSDLLIEAANRIKELEAKLFKYEYQEQTNG